MKRKFLRSESARHMRIGKNRKKLQKWRKPRGKSDKVRLEKKNRPLKVKIGYRESKKTSGLIKGLKPFLVKNLQDIEKINKENIAIIARIGAKKKIEIIKKLNEKKIMIFNVRDKK